MPTFNIARDNHYYIRRGYPWGNGNDIIFATYQVAPTGEKVFDFLQFRGGEEVSRPLFYALLLDGSLAHANLPDAISIFDLPDNEWDRASSILEQESLKELAIQLSLTRGHRLHKVLDLLSEALRDQDEKTLVGWACDLFLASRYHEDRTRYRATGQ